MKRALLDPSPTQPPAGPAHAADGGAPLLAHPELVQALWAHAADALVLSDADGIVLAANAAYLRLYGYAADAVIGHSFAIIFPPAARAAAIAQYQRVFADPAPTPVFESVIWRADGQERVVESQVTFVHTDGQRAAMLSTIRDITARTRAETALRTSEERLRVVVESVQDYAIYTLDPQGHVTSWNAGAHRIKGYTAEEIVGQPVKYFATPADVAAGTPGRAMATALRVGRAEDEGWRVRKDGTQFWANEIMTPLYADDGTHLGFTTICRDLTARKQAEDAVAQALAAEQAARAEAEAALDTRQQFLAIASHELRTPLTSLMGYAYLLPRAMRKGTDAADKAAGHILRQAERLNTLVGQLLDVARLQRGLFALERERLDLAAVVAQVVDAVHTVAHASAKHQLGLDLPDDPVWVLGDGLRLEQALLNLLSNATKYSPPGSPITVRLARTAGQAVVAVTDQGIGMSAAEQGQVWEPFYRASNVGAGTSGFGLGLYIVREIITRHDGQFEVDSTAGQGTTVRVRLPLAPMAPAATAPAALS